MIESLDYDWTRLMLRHHLEQDQATGAHTQTNWIPYVKEKLHGEAKVASWLCLCHGLALREQENIGP